MDIRRIAGATRDIGKPANWDEQLQGPCGSLPVLDTKGEGGVPYMVSAWVPDAEELERLKSGASIYLWIAGQVHPVVAMSVGEVAAEVASPTGAQPVETA